MGERNEGNPTRVFLSTEEIDNMDKDQLLQNWLKQEAYINWIESQLMLASHTSSLAQDQEEKSKPSLESVKRENFLLMKLSLKEQETQDLLVQIQELKASQIASSASLRTSLMDPAVNVLIQNLRQELEKAKFTLEETQNELSAWKFTPDSNTGKRLMAKCRLLYQENEDLGRMISSGRLAKLEGELALQRNFSEEMKKSQSELDEFLLELDEDVEGMQSTIYFLQQQLRQSREQLATVQKENDILRNARSNPEDSSISCENAHLNSNVNESTSDVEPRVTRILNGGLHHSIIIPSSLEAENCSDSPTRMSTVHDSNHCSEGDGLLCKSDDLNGDTEASDLGASREKSGPYGANTSNHVKIDASDRSKISSRRLPDVELNQCDELSDTLRTKNCETPANNDNCATLESNQQRDSPSRMDVPVDEHVDEKSLNQQSDTVSSPTTSNSHLNSSGVKVGDSMNQSASGKDESSNIADPLSQVSTTDIKLGCEGEMMDKSREQSDSNTSPLVNTNFRKRSASQTDSEEIPLTSSISCRPSGDTLSSGTECEPNVVGSKRLHVDLSETSTTEHETDRNPV